MLWQVDDFLLACDSKETAIDIFDTIGLAIQFDAKKKSGIVPFDFLGVVKDYNGVDIKQTPHFIEMSCANYMQRLLKSHRWDTDSSKPLPSEMLPDCHFISSVFPQGKSFTLISWQPHTIWIYLNSLTHSFECVECGGLSQFFIKWSVSYIDL